MSTIPDGTAAVAETGAGEFRTLTHDEYIALARAAFGDNPIDWRFRCPACGDVASARDFAAAGMNVGDAGSRCVGSLPLGPTSEPGRGCGFRGNDLLPKPWAIEMSYGTGSGFITVIRSFELALPDES